jgi:hypothetical protein
LPEWGLLDFFDCLQRWEQVESPSPELRRTVVDWVWARRDNPYAGVRRQPGFDNLWFGQVPGTLHAGTVVTCSYFIEESTRIIRCNHILSLSLPL